MSVNIGFPRRFSAQIALLVLVPLLLLGCFSAGPPPDTKAIEEFRRLEALHLRESALQERNEHLATVEEMERARLESEQSEMEWMAEQTVGAPVMEPELAAVEIAPPPSQPVFTPVIPSTPLNEVDRQLAEMDYGSIVFNTPDSLELSETFVIKLILSQQEAVAALSESFPLASHLVTEDSVKVSDLMEARLTGNMFEIDPEGPQRQGVSEIDRTTWQWEIKPKQVGKQSLHLELFVIVWVRDQVSPRRIRTFDRDIEVYIVPPPPPTFWELVWHFIKENWKWVWALIVAPPPLLIWLRNKWKNRRNQNADAIEQDE